MEAVPDGPYRGSNTFTRGHACGPDRDGLPDNTVQPSGDGSGRTAASGANVAWPRETYAAMAPHFAPGRYVNYLNVDELGERDAVAAAFGPNWSRLREVKRRYDPDNIFHLNQNILA